MGVIYVGSTDGNLLSVTSKGKVLWSFKNGDEIFGAPAISAMVLFILVLRRETVCAQF